MLSPTTSTAPTDPWHGVAPTDISAPVLNDSCALLAMMVRSQCANQSACKTDVEIDWKKMQDLKQQLADAVQRAKDAAHHSGFFGFLSSVFGNDVAQIAGAVAAIAAVVATGGAATPLILMALSVALEEGAKLGAKLGLDPKICALISLVSAAVGLCSGAGTAQATSTVTGTARDVELGASVVAGGATTTGGALSFVAGHYQAQQLDYQADATGYQAQNDATSTDFDTAIAQLQESLRTERGETATASAILQNNTDTNTALSDRI